MITKIQIKDLIDSNNQFKHVFECQWNETSLSRLYERIDAQIEGGALIDIVSAKPIEYHPERESLSVEIVLDVSDMLEQEEIGEETD